MIKAPEGARTRILTARVNHGRDWNEAINTIAPNTPDTCTVRKVGDLYLPVSKEETERQYICFNYQDYGRTWDEALAWAQSEGLYRTDPREVFAICEQNPEFHQELGQQNGSILATTECTLEGRAYTCYVQWAGPHRFVDIHWVLNFLWSDRLWYVFRK